VQSLAQRAHQVVSGDLGITCSNTVASTRSAVSSKLRVNTPDRRRIISSLPCGMCFPNAHATRQNSNHHAEPTAAHVQTHQAA
jgi:hypothetical protein